jgi:hypothetical protein
MIDDLFMTRDDSSNALATLLPYPDPVERALRTPDRGIPTDSVPLHSSFPEVATPPTLNKLLSF